MGHYVGGDVADVDAEHILEFLVRGVLLWVEKASPTALSQLCQPRQASPVCVGGGDGRGAYNIDLLDWWDYSGRQGDATEVEL